jgi:transglutaminase-like putative cysteine protease
MSISTFPTRVLACSVFALACVCVQAPRAQAGAAPLAIAAATGLELADATDRAITMESFIQRSVIARDGSADIRTEATYLVNEPRGIAMVAQLPIEYNRSRESLAIVEAYTLKASGRKVPVPPTAIIDQQEAVSAGAPMFQDGRISTIGFPELESGDRIVYVTRLARHTPMYPGQFESAFSPGLTGVGKLHLIYDLPDDMPLAGDAIGFRAHAPASANGRTVYQWDYLAGPSARIENSAVAYSDWGRRLFVSTFGSYAAMAAAYDARASDKSAVTAAIGALAAQLTAGLGTPRAKAYAINDWVRMNIRYVALYINAGGVVPHDAATILANRYGDCKDHTVLMEALLAAAGIDSTPALVSADNAYKLPEVAVTLNHVITYVPSLNLFLDSTASNVGSGYLPDALIDKQVLLTRTGVLVRTPPRQAGSIKVRSVVRLAADGSADFEMHMLIAGSWGEPTRQQMRAMAPQTRERQVGLALQGRAQHGQGSFTVADVAGRPDQLRLAYQGRSEDLIDLPGPVGLPLNSDLFDNLSTGVANAAVEKRRTQNYVCPHGDYEEEARYEVPVGMTVLAAPASLAIHNAVLDYTADYQLGERGLTVKRQLKLHHRNARCTPADFAIARPALDTIQRDLKAQLILQASQK